MHYVELHAMVNALKENEGLLLSEYLNDTDLRLEPFGLKQIQLWNSDRRLSGVICLVDRHLFPDFSAVCEREHFTPGTIKNDDYRIGYYFWEELLWQFCLVPTMFMDRCFSAAKSVNMRLADGTPTIVDNGIGISMGSIRSMKDIRFKRFPLNAHRFFTLEPEHGTKGPVVSIGVQSPRPGKNK